MLKQLVHYLKKFLKLSFGRRHNSSLNPEIQKVVQQPPELTNSDLEDLFTQLLEGVHQARGQLWALKYLERMENRISTQRWIDWLLGFGEKLLMSPAPNIHLAMRMMQLGELGIGKIGELAYDIGTSLLTRQLGEPEQENDSQEANGTVFTSLLTFQAQELTHNSSHAYLENHKDTKAVTSIGTEQEIVGEVIWEYNSRERETTHPLSDWIIPEPEEEQASIEKSWELEISSQPAQLDESLATVEVNMPNVAVTLDELFVRLEQTTDLAHQLAFGLGMETICPSQNHLEASQAWFYQGLQQARTGELATAIAFYDKALEINPHSYEYWFNRGLTLFYAGNISEAIASYEKAIEIKPNFYKGWYNKGAALGELSHFEEAIACFDKVIEIKFDYHPAWSGRGYALIKLGCPESAVSNYDQALVLDPQNQENWYYRGIALVACGRVHDAIASYEKAIELQPDFHLAWYSRGVELSKLGRFSDAISSYEQALEINPELYECWYALGNLRDKLGEWEEAMGCYDHALHINPSFHEVWIDKGVLLASLERWHDAISSWEKALLISPDLYLAWFNQAVALENLGRREEAIASYEKALLINPNFHLAWYNRGVALFYLGIFEEAIASYDYALQIQPDYWEAWIARGTAAGNALNYDNIAVETSSLNARGYEGKCASYEEGLKYVHQDTHPEGWGRLHLLLGNAHCDQARRRPTPFYYWQQAVTEYHYAQVTLTPEAFPELHLVVLQNLIVALLSLGETNQAEQIHRVATDLLRCLLNESNRTDDSKKAMALKFIGFEQLAVDIAAQSGELAQALQIAENGKNVCCSWLLFGRSDEIVSPSYTLIQQLLNPKTAIIYWHISPCTLRTFILKYNSPEPIPVFTPILNITAVNEMPIPEAVRAKVEFEDWLADWNQQYQEYRSQTQDTHKKGSHSWRANMEQRLLKLKKILNIAAIVQELEDVTHLILIPHCDLHRFPLHALFQDEMIHNNDERQHETWERQSVHRFTFTYLPSAQLGLCLKSQPPEQIHKQPLLGVEYPYSIDYPPPKYAKFEVEIITHIFESHKRIQGTKATKNKVESSLSHNYIVFHFNGHAINNFRNPQASALILAGDDKLTIEDILRLPMENYHLVTLSACETAITDRQFITTEYVGLVSAFVFHRVSFIVATLWTVDSAASALVMIQFYRQMQQNLSAPTALLAATQWLKEITVGELRKWYEDLLHQLPQEGLMIRAYLATELYRVSKMPADTKLYSHPYYWAGFTIAGRQN